MYPERFIQTSDFATLKNDSGSTTLSVTIPNGTVFNHSNPHLGTQTVSVGTINAPVRSRMTTTKRGGNWMVSSFMLDTIVTQGAGLPVDFTYVWCTLYRSSPSQMSLSIYIESFGGGPNFTTREPFTVTAVFSTFLSPFDN